MATLVLEIGKNALPDLGANSLSQAKQFWLVNYGYIWVVDI